MQNLLSPIIGKFDSVVTKVLKTGINALSSSNCSCDYFVYPPITWEILRTCYVFLHSRLNGSLEGLVFEGRAELNQSTQRKTFQSKGENQEQTQPS